MAYCEEVSALLAALANPVEREIYTTRAAETAKITPEAMRLEVQRAFKRRPLPGEAAGAAAGPEPGGPAPAQGAELRYDNIRSARAEEGILRLLIRDGACSRRSRPCGRSSSPPHCWAVPLPRCGRPRRQDASPLAAQAEFFSQEEMNHLTGVCQQPESLRNGQQALADYIRIVQTEAEKRLGADCRPAAGGHRKIQRQKGYWRKAAWQMSLS